MFLAATCAINSADTLDCKDNSPNFIYTENNV